VVDTFETGVTAVKCLLFSLTGTPQKANKKINAAERERECGMLSVHGSVCVCSGWRREQGVCQ